jgi:hypothetical protein
VASSDVEFNHFRDRDDFEVDLVMLQGRTVAGVEVKAPATVGDADFRGLRKLWDAAGSAFAERQQTKADVLPSFRA